MNVEKKIKLERLRDCVNCKWLKFCDKVKFGLCREFEESDEIYVVVDLKRYNELLECEKKLRSEEE